MSYSSNFFYAQPERGSPRDDKSFTAEYNSRLANSLVNSSTRVQSKEDSNSSRFPGISDSVPTNGVDIVSEIAEISHRLNDRLQDGSSSEGLRNESKSTRSSLVHARPYNDTHYPFKTNRKQSTRMRSRVCVWCAAHALMTLTSRPVLQKRVTSTYADWERWMDELSAPNSEFLENLVDKLMPKEVVLNLLNSSELEIFYKEIASALIELALRELRADDLEEHSLMAQIRSSKYHKSLRLAAIIEAAYNSP